MGQGLLEAIALDLSAKFGRAGAKLLPRIRENTDVKGLRGILRAIKKVKTLEQVSKRLRSSDA